MAERRRPSVRRLLAPLGRGRDSLKRRRRRDVLGELLRAWCDGEDDAAAAAAAAAAATRAHAQRDPAEAAAAAAAARRLAAQRILETSELVADNTLRGDVDLADIEALEALPPFVHIVEGSLDLERCTSLRSLGDNLVLVTGNLNCLRCKSLASLPPRLCVDGWANLGRCRALAEIPPGVHIGDWVSLHGCSALTAIDGLANVGGALRLYQCQGLRALRHIDVQSDLDASACALEEVDAVRVGGSLDLSQNRTLRALVGPLRAGFARLRAGEHSHPHAFSISLANCGLREVPPQAIDICDQGGLDLSGNSALTSVSALRCTVGKLNLAHCAQLRDLGPDLSVLWTLNLAHCAQLRALPPGLHLQGDLTVSHCASLVELPADLSVDGDLECVSCHALARVGAVSVGGRANFGHCNALHSLEAGAAFGGSIILEQCVSLLRLPDDWTEVRGDLSLRFCAELVELPPEMRVVEGVLDLFECSRLRALPEGLVARDGVVGFAANTQTLGDSWTLALAVNFWARDAAAPRRRSRRSRTSCGSPRASIPGKLDQALAERMARAIRLEPAYERNVLIFLDKLRHTKDFAIAPEIVRAQVREAFEIVADDPGSDAAREILLRMTDAVNACHDKPAWALSQIHALSAVVAARDDRDALRDIGRRIMRLGMVQDAAMDMAREDRALDDVSVFLALQCQLREDLDLAVLVRDFLFRKLSGINADEVDALRSAVLAVPETAFEAWLSEWSPWQRLLRVETAASVLASVDALPIEIFPAAELAAAQDLFGDPVKTPVILRGVGPAICDLDQVLDVWVSSGRVISPPVALDPEALRRALARCSPRLQDPKNPKNAKS